jgi:MFS superfamily sulfate permease-like transporter
MNSNMSLGESLKHDIPASVVVFLVALPLCLGIALASGAPLFSGLIAGIVGGIVVGALSGSRLGVSGPAAGLAVIVFTAINSLGSFEAFLVAVVLAGLLQLAMGYLRAGVIGYYFPSSVIKGMLSGIGLTIILKQLPHAVGYDADPTGDMAFVQSNGENTLSALGTMLSQLQPGALVVGLVSMAILLLWDLPFIKRIKATTWIQGPLVAVVMGVVLNQIFADAAPALAIKASHLVQIPMADGLSGLVGLLTFPDFSHLSNPAVYTTALTLAVVASLETLLCVEATDKLDPSKRVTPTNRELKAQGAGNVISGLLGGLPLTQVIVRSSANIQAGGQTKISAILHGVLLVVAVIAIPALLNLIPLSVLAAVLITVGYKLAKPALFRSMYAQGPYQFIPFIVTIIGILTTDLLIGIGLGLAVAIFTILLNNYQHAFFVDRDPTGAVRVVLSEDVSFLNRVTVMRALAEVPAGARVVIDASRSMSIDHDVFEILQDFRQRAVVENINVTFEGLDGLRRDNDAMHRISREFAADTKNNPSGSKPVSGRPTAV